MYVTVHVQSDTSEQEMARAQIAAANRLLASTSSITFNSCDYCGRVFSKKEVMHCFLRGGNTQKEEKINLCNIDPSVEIHIY